MKYIIALISFFSVFRMIGQDFDLVNHYNEQAKYFISRDKDSTKYYCELAHSLNRGRFPVQEGLSKLYVGMYYKRQGAYDTAYWLFNDAKEIFLKYKEESKLGNAYWYMGKVWHELQQYERAIPLYEQSLKKYEEIDEASSQVKVLNGMGMMEANQAHWIVSLEIFKQCLEIIHKHELQGMSFKIYFNIAGVYKKMDEFELALKNLRKGIGLPKSESDRMDIIRTYNSMAGIFDEQNQKDSARFYYELALKKTKEWNLKQRYIDMAELRLSEFEGDFEKCISLLRSLLMTEHTVEKSQFLSQLTRIYKSNNEIDSAIHYGQIAYHYNIDHHSNEHAKNNALVLSNLYEKKNDLVAALSYQKKYTELSDLIRAENDLSKSRDILIKLETIEAANTIEKLQATILLKQLREVSLIKSILIFLFVLAILGVILYSRIRARKMKLHLQMQQKDIELENKNKELQMQTLHMTRHINTIKELEDGLKNLMPEINGSGQKVQKLVNSIKLSRNMNREWEKFDSYFSNVHEGFTDQLKSAYPLLTIKDLRLCTLLRLNLSNSEIATILNIEPKSIAMSKYRLRKKMNIPKEVDLLFLLQEK